MVDGVFGEDFLSPFQEVDTRFNHTRGDFSFNAEMFDVFIRACERLPRKSSPKWKSELLERAITYYTIGVRSGIDMMPMNFGFFGMCLECLGNVAYGKRDKHYTLGDKQFLSILRARLVKSKQNPATKDKARALEKSVIHDIELTNKLRNMYYGHSLLHLTKDRRELRDILRKWYRKSGHSTKFAELTFKLERIDDDVTREAWGLYKVGLRICQLFIFMVLGIPKSIPVATHDFSTIGDLFTGEEHEFRGIKMIVTSPRPAIPKTT